MAIKTSTNNQIDILYITFIKNSTRKDPVNIHVLQIFSLQETENSPVFLNVAEK